MQRGLSMGLGLISCCFAFLILPLLPASVGAEESAPQSFLQIQFTGLNLVYDGNAIYDAGSSNVVGTGDPGEADPLATMSFSVDGTPQGTLTTGISADVKINMAGVLIPVGGGSVMSAGPFPDFGFDLLTKTTIPGWGISIQLSSPLQISFSGTSLFIMGSGTTNSVGVQDLPSGLHMDTPVQFSFSAAATNVEDDGQYVTAFHASGSGEVGGVIAAVSTRASTWGRVKQLYLEME